MRQFSLTIVLLLLFGGVSFTKLDAQQITNSNLLQNLLDLPAPPPNPIRSKQLADRIERPEGFYDLKKVPPDDAPIEDLLDYWATQNQMVRRNDLNRDGKFRPSEESLRRIVEACQTQPEKLAQYLELISDKPEMVENVKRMYEDELQTQKLGGDWLSSVKSWLLYHSSYFADEIYAKSQKAKDARGNTDNEEELKTLAKIDWEKAKPLLERLENDDSQPVTATSAKWTLYQHALDTKDDEEAEKYRSKLKALVEDRTLAPSVRDKAMDALALTPFWQGRDEWYLSLLSDETLFELKSENGGFYTGLTTLVSHEDEDKWIPIMSKLVLSNNQAVHNAAVRNLMMMHSEARKDLLEPLLPWLFDPNWAKEPEKERRRFISMLRSVDLPESIPGLIAVVMNEKGEYRANAALALAKYKDARAIPALRLALSEEPEHYLRQNYIEALIACGGFTDDEQAAGLEAFAVAQVKMQELAAQNPDNFDAPAEYEKIKTISFSIGNYLMQSGKVGDGVIIKSFERLKILQTTNPKAAELLSYLIQRWESRVVDLALLGQVNSNKADVEIIVRLLASRQELRTRVLNELYSMRGNGGVGRGISAVITEDQSEMFSILGASDVEANIAMLGCARLVRAPLPVQSVAPLLKDKNKLLVLAAERYLESEDSLEAQALVRAQHPSENLILGAKDSFNPSKNGVSGQSDNLIKLFLSVNNTRPLWQALVNVNRFEEKLQSEVKENGDLIEVYGFLPNAQRGQVTVRVFKDRAVFTVYDDASRYHQRNLSSEELEVFRNNLAQNNIETMPPLYACQNSCEGSEFVTLSKTRGRRVFIRANEGVPEPLDKLQSLFEEFGKSDKMKLHYYLEDKIKGLEILLADKTNEAKAVWKRGSDLRVLVADSAKYEANVREAEKAAELAAAGENSDEEKANEIAQKNNAKLEFAHFSWRDLQSDGSLGAALPQPTEASFLRDDSDVNLDKIADERRAWQVRSGEYEIHLGNSEDANGAALIKTSRSQTPVILKKGGYGSPLVTPDGKWVIAAKNEPMQKPPYRGQSIWRINVLTGKEFKIDFPPAISIAAIAFATGRNKFLIGRAKSYNSVNAEYFLLDAETGLTEPIQGNFQPLLQQTYRPLQNTAKANVYWAAIADEKAGNTQFGLYDTETFVFKPLMTLPDIQFDSMNCWVDETGGKLYFIYEGHLLAVPLPKETTP